jgi:hypothetical protein
MKGTRVQNQRMRRPWSLLLCASIPWAVLPADRCAAYEQSPSELAVVTADGDVIEGRLQLQAETLTVELEAGRTRSLDREEVVRIRRTAAGQSPALPQALTLLVNGDVLAGLPIRVADDLLSLDWSGTTPPSSVQVPLEFVRAIVFAQPDDDLEQERLQRQWGLPRAGSDRLLLKNRTTVDGELDGIDGRNVLLSTGLGPVNMPRAEIAALTLNSELASRIPVPEVSAILLCADGSRITLRDTTIDKSSTVSGTAVFGAEIFLPLEQMVSLQFFNERVQPLVGSEPTDYKFTPFLTGKHPLVTNRNVLGGPLRLRGVQFATGLGVQSRSEVTYDLGEEGWTSFTATIGIDDVADGEGLAVFRVSVDGETTYDSGDVSGRDEPIVVGPLDLSGARHLTLMVDFGRRGNIRDIANWCDPLLTR